MRLSDFKVGSLVRLKSDLVIDQEYGGLELLDTMAEFKGRKLTVCRRGEFTDHPGQFFVEFHEDPIRFTFTYAMIEPFFKYGK